MTNVYRQAFRGKGDERSVEPFLRWAGGKQWLVSKLLPLIPKDARYFEPFLGGGSLFFALRPKKAFLGDVNSRLVEAYRAVRDHPKRVASYLAQWPNDQETYYRVRAKKCRAATTRAAQLIYLNKTCWNGLYRVNRSGLFNVPYGNNPRRATHDPQNLMRAAKALKAAQLIPAGFRKTVERASRGDFVYLDPPYTVLHGNNGFRRYNEQLFLWEDQKRLAEVAQALVSLGCLVAVSNADHPDLVQLYKSFRPWRLSRNSMIASDTRRRGSTTELLFLSPSLCEAFGATVGASLKLTEGAPPAELG